MLNKKSSTMETKTSPKQEWIPETLLKKTIWTKPGLKSTEFWSAIGISLLQLSKVVVLPSWAMPVAWGLYTIARGLAKSGGPEITE